jgi:hypothetical protein
MGVSDLCAFAVRCFHRQFRVQRLRIVALAAVQVIATIGSDVWRDRGVCQAGEKERPPALSSIAHEAEFWDKWLTDQRSTAHLPLFFFSQDLQTPIDIRLREMANHSDILAIVIDTCVNKGRFQVIALTKNSAWQQTNWEMQMKGGVARMNESHAVPSDIDDKMLRDLSGRPAFVASDSAFDAETVLIYVQFHGKRSRFAVYNPTGALRGQLREDPTAAALESLFWSVGVYKKTKVK